MGHNFAADLQLTLAFTVAEPPAHPDLQAYRKQIRRLRHERNVARKKARADWLERQGLLFAPRWLEPPPAVVRLPVVPTPMPCETCKEMVHVGERRRRLGQHLRNLRRQDHGRALAGCCAIPCVVVEEQLDPQNPCLTCPHRAGCAEACYLLDKVIPKSDPLYYDEIPTEPHALFERSVAVEEPLDLSRWRWADIADDLRLILQRAIRRCLTEKQQIAVSLSLEGMSGVQIARRLGVSKVTVHWYLVRARRRLKAEMMKSQSARARLRQGLDRTYQDEETEVG